MKSERQRGPVPLVIVGGGGFGREVLDIVEAINAGHSVFNFLGFLDDGNPDLGLIRDRGAEVLGAISELERIDANYVIGIASPAAREKIDRFATSIGRTPATLLHPSATVGSNVSFGPGSIVCSHVSVTTHIRTGRHVQLHVNCAIGHDTEADDYVTVLPGATVSGNVILKRGVTLGTNSCVIQGLVVGEEAIVGAGGAVVRSVPPSMTVGGVPARSLRHEPQN